MDMQRILVVAAHPDDDILGCGATMNKLIGRGKEVRVVFVAEGSTCRFERETVASPEAREAVEQRSQCAREALRVVGVRDLAFHDLPCGRLDTVPLIDIGKFVEQEITQFRPDTVLTHFEHDANNDHRIVFQAVLQATRPGAQNFVANLLSFEVASSTEWRFTKAFLPNFFVNVEGEIKVKEEALSKYVTEQRPFPFPRSPQGMVAQSQVRGAQAGCRNAEAFMIIRSIEP